MNDDLTQQILASEQTLVDAKQRGYPNIPVRCGECGKVEDHALSGIALNDWEDWERDGKRILAGYCFECTEPEEDLEEALK